MFYWIKQVSCHFENVYMKSGYDVEFSQILSTLHGA